MNEQIDWKQIGQWIALWVCVVYLVMFFLSACEGMLHG